MRRSAPISVLSSMMYKSSAYIAFSFVAMAWTDAPSTSRSMSNPVGEVVGAKGKIGSYVFHKINAPNVSNTSNINIVNELKYHPSAASVPRGSHPGSLSPDNTPIYACIPSSSISDVWQSTLPHRRKDLVFLCNIIPSRHLAFESGDMNNGVTVAILHFGVSHGNKNSKQAFPRLNNSPKSPPTVIYGKHAATLSTLLRQDGIPVHICNDAEEIQAAAAKKLAWSSLMWLMCHGCVDGDGDPMNAKGIHRLKSKQLQKLVEEILPALDALASEKWVASESERSHVSPAKFSAKEILDYLESYSMSMNDGDVVPSRRLAEVEIEERNGLLLSLLGSEHRDRSYHADMIRKVAGDDLLARLLP